MKKLLAIVFIGGLVLASCEKKESTEESNTMLSEPDASAMDSTQTITTPTATSTVDSVVSDSAATR